MDEDRSLHLTPAQLAHEGVLREVSMRMSDTPYVLKGGTALLLTRGLDRHSTDLDFDSSKPLNIEARIRSGIEAAGGEITRFSLSKDTSTVQRFKVHYEHPDASEPIQLRVETSFRQAPNERDIETVDGIQTYRLSALIDQKLTAGENRDKARDLHDLSWLIEKHGAEFSDEQLERLDRYSLDADGLSNRMDAAFRDDAAMPLAIGASDAVLTLREHLETEHIARLDRLIEIEKENLSKTLATISDAPTRARLEVEMGQTISQSGPQLDHEPHGLYQNVAKHGFGELASASGREEESLAKRALSEITEKARGLGLNSDLLLARYAEAAKGPVTAGTEALWSRDDSSRMMESGVSADKINASLESFHRAAAGLVSSAMDALSKIRERSHHAEQSSHSL